MRDRGDILNHADIQPCGLQRTDGGLTPGARALYINLNRFHAVLHRSLGSCFSSGLCGKGGGFSGATEAHFARACPGYRIALCIRDSHNGIVERGLDMRRTAFDIFTLTASARGNGLFPGSFCSHSIPPSLLLLVRDRLLRALTCAGVRLRALAPHGQALAMPHATVTADFDEPFDIKGRLPAQVALYLDVMVNILTKLGNIVFAQVLDPDIRVYACGFDDVAGGLAAMP